MQGLSNRTGITPRNGIYICVDEVNKGITSGRLYNCYSREAIPFVSQVQMMLLMEEFYDRINYPQSTTRGRAMNSRKESTVMNREAELVRDEQDLKNQVGQKASFIIRVNSRQNATWQGSVSWTEKGVTKYFRSALELLKLIDSALLEEEQKTEE